MTGASIAFALLASVGPAPALTIAQVSVRERIIIRVPKLPPRALRAANGRIVPPKPIAWKESKGPRCLALRSLAGAAIASPSSVDLVLRGGARYRAKLERGCPALDFYRGFYLKPNRDGQVCADRDMLHDRSGNQCEVAVFRTLSAAK